jgi:hypothetical protein
MRPKFDLYNYHTQPALLYGVVNIEGSLFDVGQFDGKNIFIVSGKYEENLNWGDATEYCNHLSVDGYSDFRLPTEMELHFIFENRHKLGLSVDQHGTWFKFKTTPNDYYWSSTESSDLKAKVHHMGELHRLHSAKTDNRWVRAIRTD